MSTQTLAPGRTVRQIKPINAGKNGFERLAWVFMRYSGLALLFLALFHFVMQHIFIGTHMIQTSDTMRRWGVQGETINIDHIAWRLYYMVTLLLAMLHGLNGLRQVVYDYIHAKPVYNTIMTVAVVLIGGITLLGALALLIGAAAAPGIS
jgi:succinate dehydrogenase / fumarate reductase, membrane anchor subunit